MNPIVQLYICLTSPFSDQKELIEHMKGLVPQYYPPAPVMASLDADGTMVEINDIEYEHLV